jgi:hypothetical protein
VLLRVAEARRARVVLRAAGLTADFAPAFRLRGEVVLAVGIRGVLLFFLARRGNGYGFDASSQARWRA